MKNAEICINQAELKDEIRIIQDRLNNLISKDVGISNHEVLILYKKLNGLINMWYKC